MKRKNIVFWIICLIFVDQVSKIIIAKFFIDTKFYIIQPILGFSPIFNNQFSYFNSILKLNLGLLPHTIILVLIQLIMVLCYDYYRNIQHPDTLFLDISFIFGQSALICVFCGFYFWETGILDFIYLYFWTVDFKDIYLNCFVLLFVVNYLKKKTEFRNSKIIFKDYFLNILVRFKNQLLH